MPKKVKSIPAKNSKVLGSKKKDSTNDLYAKIRDVIEQSRTTAYKAVNFSMVIAYWNIGKLIVEDEQEGNKRAQYGKAILENLAIKLTEEFGKGFEYRNIANMRQFYLTFSILHTLCAELSWSHYKLLMKIDDGEIRDWYMNEAKTCGWSVRQLDRQISTLYYERIIGSKNKKPVIKEAKDKLTKLEPEDFIKDPYVLEFLNLKNYPDLREKNLESALINNLCIKI